MDNQHKTLNNCVDDSGSHSRLRCKQFIEWVLLVSKFQTVTDQFFKLILVLGSLNVCSKTVTVLVILLEWFEMSIHERDWTKA